MSEGFATLFEYHITGILYPEWRVRDLFTVRTLHSAFRFDSQTSARAMTKDITTVAEISGTFDTISYGKGEIINNYGM
jgi:aminopeptidase N